jgi:multiple sugar transport system permease protein
MIARNAWLAQLAVSLAAGLFLIPLLLLVSSSFKSADELKSNPFAVLPSEPTLENYRQVLAETPFRRQLKNTLLLCGGSVLGTLISCSLAAYGFARLRWLGNKLLFALLIATMLLPWQVTMIPRFLLIRELGGHDTLASLILPTFFGEAFYIFLLRQFMLTIPEDISEAGESMV